MGQLSPSFLKLPCRHFVEATGKVVGTENQYQKLGRCCGKSVVLKPLELACRRDENLKFRTIKTLKHCQQINGLISGNLEDKNIEENGQRRPCL